MFRNISYLYDEILSLRTDDRVSDKFLMGSPLPILAICIGYAIATTKFTNYMKNHPKLVLDMKVPILMLQFYYLIVSCYILNEFIKYMIWSNYDIRCQPVDTSYKPESIKVSFLSN